ncbi:MAG: hybrid sensor histidine kinase/response regulator [Syntrophus sp. (in: bacteria)]|nr:hybrid sensor histidine kinase/response regulator [Syntrophus sp. (in: bacteria)]
MEDTDKTKEELCLELAAMRIQFDRLEVMRTDAEEALRQSEAKYRHFYENVAEGIFQTTPDGHLISVNPALAKMYGCELPQEMVETLTDIEKQLYVDPGDRVRFKKILEKDGVVSNFEVRFRRKDGQIRWLSINAHAVRDGDGNIACHEGCAEDITSRKESEEALRKERETFFTILENDPTGVAMIDPNGAYQYINPEFTRITGYTLQDIPNGKNWFLKSFPDPAYREKVIRTWKKDRLLETGKCSDREFTVTCKDGSPRDIDIRTTFMKDFSISVFRDVTERRQAEKTLRESETKYRTVVEDSLVGFSIIQDGYFRFVNKRFCEMFGYAYEEIVDTFGPGDLTHPDDRKRVDETVQKQIGGEIEHIEYDFRSLRKDGKVITVKALGSTILYRGRLAAVGSIIDITSTRERELEGKLRQAQKMGAIGTLAGGIAHDFNNILTVLTGYGELLKMETTEGDRLRQYADQILTASMKAAQLTRSLLTFSRQQPTVLSPLHINNVIRETEKLLNRLITEDIALHTILAAEDIIVMADVTQIDQILFNLATNARDAMPKGGALTIETRSISIDHDFVEIHGFGEPGQYVLISVSDTGIGMDSKAREQMFDPFYTTKEVGKGTGLGLSTVYGIVMQHNGYINVYSEPQMGTTFHIYLPATSAASEEAANASEIRGGTETLLIAEDNDAVRHAMSDMLRKYGYTVIGAIDGQDAVEIFARDGDIDLIILDSVMPKKNGRETYEEIKNIKPGIKVLFISGYTRDIILDKGIRDKEFPFIPKPVLPTTLLQTLREILDK